MVPATGTGSVVVVVVFTVAGTVVVVVVTVEVVTGRPSLELQPARRVTRDASTDSSREPAHRAPAHRTPAIAHGPDRTAREPREHQAEPFGDQSVAVPAFPLGLWLLGGSSVTSAQVIRASRFADT